MDLKKIVENFKISGDFRGYKTFTSGNINSTYELMLFDNGEIKTYVLQKINKYVFKKPNEVMENIMGVTKFMRNKLGAENSNRYVLHYFSTKDDLPYYVDENGDYWRCYEFIDNSVTYDTCVDNSVITEAGSAFGKFQKMLIDYDASSLHETIVDFHNTRQRLTNLFHAIIADEVDRVKTVKEELNYFIDNREKAEYLCTMLSHNMIPLRVTHNDTKCNNVLFDIDTGKSLAVIDLDTIMPGLVAYDFGDAVRSIACSTAEDETDLSKVYFDLEKFEAFAKGFLPELKGIINDNEIESLCQGAYVITTELASRFLEDYLNGDKYFKINYPMHNLDRARCQLALAKDIYAKREEINNIIKRYV